MIKAMGSTNDMSLWTGNCHRPLAWHYGQGIVTGHSHGTVDRELSQATRTAPWTGNCHRPLA